MARETEFTFATTSLDKSQLGLAGRARVANRQGYVPNTGVNGFRVHFDYSSRFDTALMHLSMRGQKMTTIEIASPLDPDGFDLNSLVSQKGFFIHQPGARSDYKGELFIGQLRDGRSSELRSILSTDTPSMSSVGIKIDVIDAATGKIDPTTRIECERKVVENTLAANVLKRFCVGQTVQKSFYDLPDMPGQGIQCYLQEFTSRAHRGLVLVEFEMDRAIAKTFERPSWLRNAFDVTSVPTFRTRALAMGGGMWRSVFNSFSRVADSLTPAAPQQEALSL